MNKRVMVSLCVLVVALVLIVTTLFSNGWKKEKKQEVPKVGFIMTGSVDEAGWNGMHYQGILTACNNRGAELIVKENVLEYTGVCPQAIQELIDEGAKIIFLSSFGYAEESKDIIERNKDVIFYSESSSYSNTDNISTYFARMYQGRYLSGIVAGMMTSTNQIGYVAAMDNCEVNRGINAFALGVKKVNPDAQVIVMWTGEWNNKEEEERLARILVEEKNVDVLSYHQNMPNVVMAAQELSVYSIGYHESMRDKADKCLTSVICDWEKLYDEIIRTYLTGKASGGETLWLGIDKGVVGLAPYHPGMPEEVMKKVEEAKAELLAGKEVFSGEIYDNKGNLRCGEGEMISDKTLMENIDWHVEGVSVYEK